MMYILYAVIAVLIIFIAVILIRASLFKANEEKFAETKTTAFGEEKAIQNFCDMIKIKTISVLDRKNGDYSHHKDFFNLLKERYPLIMKNATSIQIEKYGLIFKITGKSDEKPTVLMSHYDVVPVEGQKWDHDPFLGEVLDGYVYGRGTVDTKSSLLCICESTEILLEKGFKPQNDLYLCFGGDEEIGGYTCTKMVNYLKNIGVKPTLVLDEGGAIVTNIFPGVSKESAVIGVGEKGMCNLELVCENAGGHASTPTKDNPAAVIAKAISKLEKNQMKPCLIAPVKEMLDVMGRNSKFSYKIIFANLWIFSPLVKKLFTKLSGETRALCQTTFAFTMLSGSMSHNVLPTTASVNINIRILNNNSMNDVLSHVAKVIKDDRVKINVYSSGEPSKMADTSSAGYQIVKETLKETFDDIIISPYLMLACSDSRHYGEISDVALKFAPFRLSKEERGSIHAANEKISIENIFGGINFYINLIKKL